jgi:uncharacterized DUF497 family protein
MKFFDWNVKKNEELKAERNVGFEDVLFSIMHDGLLDIVEHPNKQKYPGQRVFIVKIEDYVYLVPFVEEEKVIFLKTIIPSRKMTKKYLGEKNEDKKGRKRTS